MRNRFLFAIFIFIFSCSSKYPFCINEGTKQLEIHWGTIYKKPIEIEERYVLLPSGDVYKVVSANRKIKIRRLEPKVFCSTLEQINSTILKTQAINEWGDTLNFVEYHNKKLGVYFIAKWQPRFKTKNSVFFRELFDSLKVLTFERKN